MNLVNSDLKGIRELAHDLSYVRKVWAQRPNETRVTAGYTGHLRCSKYWYLGIVVQRRIQGRGGSTSAQRSDSATSIRSRDALE